MNKDEKIMVVVFLLCVFAVGMIDWDTHEKEQQAWIHSNF